MNEMETGIKYIRISYNVNWKLYGNMQWLGFNEWVTTTTTMKLKVSGIYSLMWISIVMLIVERSSHGKAVQIKHSLKISPQIIIIIIIRTKLKLENKVDFIIIFCLHIQSTLFNYIGWNICEIVKEKFISE